MRMAKFCHPARQACEETSQVLWRYFTQSWWTQWRRNATVKGHSFLNLPAIFLSLENPGHTPGGKSQLSSQEPLYLGYVLRRIVLFENDVFNDQKGLLLVLTGATERYWHICGGPFFPGLPCFGAPAYKTWYVLVNWGFKQAGPLYPHAK